MDMEIARLANHSSLENGRAFAIGAALRSADDSQRHAGGGSDDAARQLPALDWPATLFGDETSELAPDGEGGRHSAHRCASEATSVGED